MTPITYTFYASYSQYVCWKSVSLDDFKVMEISHQCDTNFATLQECQNIIDKN